MHQFVELPSISPQHALREPRAQTLVAYYSRTGTTQLVAQSLARELGAPTEVIAEARPSDRPRPAWQCAANALLRRCTALAPDRHDPLAYDLVIVGSPVWYATTSSPVRSYLARYAGQLKDVAFFVTCGGWRPDRALRHMADVSRTSPCATLAVTRRDLSGGGVHTKILAFTDKIRELGVRGDSDHCGGGQRDDSRIVSD